MSALRSFLRHDLTDAGFAGWRTWDELGASAFEAVPRTAGTYLVYRPSTAPPQFLAVGMGAHFKGRDPNVAIATLKAKWVPGAHTDSLGKADKLRTRLRTYAKFGAGDPKAAHWGGRYIWHLPTPTSCSSPAVRSARTSRRRGWTRSTRSGALPSATTVAGRSPN